MLLEAKQIEELYSGKAAMKYDFHMSHFFAKYKQLAFDESSLKPGDSVLVYCCGTGLDFPHILKKIGTEGKIVGIDFSSAMLEIAAKRIKRRQWKNVELIEADITKADKPFDEKFDVGVCTLGLSIIPQYKAAYENLISNIKAQGEVIIADMQLATGFLGRFNPFTIYLSRKFGGSYKGHKNSTDICNRMKAELDNVVKREFLLNSYFYCIGKTK